MNEKKMKPSEKKGRTLGAELFVLLLSISKVVLLAEM